MSIVDGRIATPSNFDRCPYCGVEVEDASDCERPVDVCHHDSSAQYEAYCAAYPDNVPIR